MAEAVHIVGGRATAGDFQLSTDGFSGYPNAVEYALGGRAAVVTG